MKDDGRPSRFYTELAAWWPLLSPASEYVEEAEVLVPILLSATDAPRTLLELGAGGGSLAYHLKDRFQLTLTDLSPDMLAQSSAINPECEHLVGDMRSLDLGRTFDIVLIHDAIMHMTDPDSLRAAFRVAHRHCRPGGAVVILPDCVKETFEPDTESGGHDAPDGRGLRYLEWSWDPEPADDTGEVAYAFLLREADGAVHSEMDRFRFGLFPRASWLGWLGAVGFSPSTQSDPWRSDIFVGKKPLGRKT